MAVINLQPVLYGKLMRLRPLKVQDFQNLYKAASDQQIWQQHPEPMRTQRQYFRSNYFKPALEGESCLVAVNSRQDIIGCSRYYNYRPKFNDIAIGYTFLTRDYWGTAANREMKHLMITHVFEWVQTLLLIVSANNFRSRKAVQKIGAQLLTQEERNEKELRLVDKVVYQIQSQKFKGLM